LELSSKDNECFATISQARVDLDLAMMGMMHFTAVHHMSFRGDQKEKPCSFVAVSEKE